MNYSYLMGIKDMGEFLSIMQMLKDNSFYLEKYFNKK